MAWSTSRLMRQWQSDLLGQTYTTMSQVDLDAATNLFAALYDDTITPDGDATNLLSTYAGAASIWSATGSQTGGPQVFHAGQWAQGGIVVPTPAVSVVAGGIVQFTSANLVSGAAATMSNIEGMFLYFNNVTGPANQVKAGLGYWWFGGTNYAVTAGTLTITPNASGLFRMTV